MRSSGPRAKSKWPARLRQYAFERALLGFVRRQMAEIGNLNRNGEGRRNDLRGLAFRSDKGRSQRFMAGHQSIHAALQNVEVESGIQPVRARNVVGGAVWIKLIHDPHALLCGRQR